VAICVAAAAHAGVSRLAATAETPRLKAEPGRPKASEAPITLSHQIVGRHVLGAVTRRALAEARGR